MNKIHYLKGDAVYPQARGNIIITHICNDIGVWGRGFVVALSARWMAPEIEFLICVEHDENQRYGADTLRRLKVIKRDAEQPIRAE